MSVIYPLVKSRRITGAVCGHFLSPSRTHLVLSYPGELVVKEVFSSANEYGENQYIPCASRLHSMYKLPRQDRQVDWLMLAFAETGGYREPCFLNFHVVEFEGDSLIERASFKLAAYNDLLIICDARFGRIAVTTGRYHVLHIFNYDNPESPLLTHRELKNMGIAGLTWISDKRLVVRTSRSGAGGMLILDITRKRGEDRTWSRAYVETSKDLTFVYAGIDNTILRVDQNPRSVVLVCFTEGSRRLEHQEVKIPLPFASSDCDLYFLARHSDCSSFLLLGKHYAYKFDLNTTSTLPTISDSGSLSYRNPIFEHQAKSENDLLSHCATEKYLVGSSDDSRVVINWSGKLVELLCSAYSRLDEAKANIIIESPTIPQTINILERFSTYDFSTCCYLLGTAIMRPRSRGPMIDDGRSHFLEVCRIRVTEKELFKELAEIPHTESVLRLWAQGSLIVLSTEHQSRFMRINMEDLSLMSVDKREWQINEPTLAVNSHIQVTNSAIHGIATHIKHEGAYLAAANDSVVIVVRSENSGATVFVDIYDLGSTDLGGCNVTFKETQKFNQPVLAIALDDRTNQLAICFNTHILVKDTRYSLPGPAYSLVFFNGEIMIGLMDGRAMSLFGDKSDKTTVLLNVGRTPVTVSRPLEDETVILSCSTNTIVYKSQSSSCTSLCKAAVTSIARLPGENLVIMVGGMDECVKIQQISSSDDETNDFSYTRIEIEPWTEDIAVVVDHLENTLWYCSGSETIYHYSIEQYGRDIAAKKIHEIPLGFRINGHFKCEMAGLSLSQHCDSTIDALLIVVKPVYAPFSLQAIFPKLGVSSEVIYWGEERSPPDSDDDGDDYYEYEDEASFNIDENKRSFSLVSLPCSQEGVGRAHLRVMDLFLEKCPLLEVKVSTDGIEVTEVVDFDETGEFFVRGRSMYFSPTPLSLRRSGGQGDIILYEEGTKHDDGTLVYSRRQVEVEIVEAKTKELVHVPLVLCSGSHFLDILEPKISPSKSFGKLTRSFRARMTDEKYRIIPAHPSVPDILTGVRSNEKCLDPSAYLVGESQGDIHVWIEILDAQLLHDLESLELAIRSSIQKSVTFFDPEASQRVIDGKLLRHMFLYCSRSARIELYRHSNISHDRGEAIRHAFLSVHC